MEKKSVAEKKTKENNRIYIANENVVYGKLKYRVVSKKLKKKKCCTTSVRNFTYKK